MSGPFSSAFTTAFNVYTFQITTAFLPIAHETHPYSTQLTASEVGPVWTLESGVLPSGITLTVGGLISGAPIGAGLYPISVRATSSLTSTTDDEAYTMVVLSSSSSDWGRHRSIRNFRLFGGIYGK